MNKDAILATIIGFSIGLVVTTILLFGPTIVNSLGGFQFPKLSSLSPTTSPVAPTESPTTLGVQQSSLTIDAPQTESITNSSELLVSGSANAGSAVTISGSVDDSISTASADGKFAGTITVTEGKNDILVTSVTNGKYQSLIITVYYTPENF